MTTSGSWTPWISIMEPGELMYITDHTGLDLDLLNAVLWQRCTDIQGGPAYQAEAPDGGTVTIWFYNNPSSGLAGVTYDRKKERESPMSYPVKQPPLPPEERLKAMTAIMIEAGRAHQDIGEILVASLHAAADALGDVEALVAGRPGSWEADIVRRMASAPVGSRDVQRYKKYIQRLVPLFIEMGKAGEDGGDVLSQAMGPAVDELGGLAEFAGDSTYWSHDLINIGRQYSKHWDDDIY